MKQPQPTRKPKKGLIEVADELYHIRRAFTEAKRGLIGNKRLFGWKRGFFLLAMLSIQERRGYFSANDAAYFWGIAPRDILRYWNRVRDEGQLEEVEAPKRDRGKASQYSARLSPAALTYLSVVWSCYLRRTGTEPGSPEDRPQPSGKPRARRTTTPPPAAPDAAPAPSPAADLYEEIADTRG